MCDLTMSTHSDTSVQETKQEKERKQQAEENSRELL
jgi:hypothetical protein